MYIQEDFNKKKTKKILFHFILVIIEHYGFRCLDLKYLHYFRFENVFYFKVYFLYYLFPFL